MTNCCVLGSQSSESVGMGEGDGEGEGDIEGDETGEVGAVSDAFFFRDL